MIDYKKEYGVHNIKPSPIDYRDYTLDKLVVNAPNVPNEYITPIDILPITDQGQTSTCFANSIALSRYIQEYIQNGTSGRFSITYFYGNRADTDSQDEGMCPRDGFKRLAEYGDCHWVDCDGFYDYPTSKAIYKRRKEELDMLAKPYRISKYYRLSSKFDIKVALIELGVVSGAFPVFECLYSPSEDGKIIYDPKDTDICGYHAMTIIGYNNYGWIVANSWGTDYGKNGIINLPYDYPINEAWAMVDEIKEQEIKNR